MDTCVRGVDFFLTILPALRGAYPSETLATEHSLITEESKNVPTLGGTKLVVYC